MPECPKCMEHSFKIHSLSMAIRPQPGFAMIPLKAVGVLEMMVTKPPMLPINMLAGCDCHPLNCRERKLFAGLSTPCATNLPLALPGALIDT